MLSAGQKDGKGEQRLSLMHLDALLFLREFFRFHSWVSWENMVQGGVKPIIRGRCAWSKLSAKALSVGSWKSLLKEPRDIISNERFA